MAPIDRTWDHRGAAMVEAAVAIPLVLIFVLGLAQLAQVCEPALGLEDVVRETALSGTRLPAIAGAAADQNPSLSQYLSCIEEVFTPACAHTVLHWRARRLLESHRLSQDGLQLSTEFNATARILTVDMTIAKLPFQLFFPAAPELHRRQSAGYLGEIP